MPDIHYTDGSLYLCTNVPLDPEYNYTIDFNNRTAQATYFDSLVTNTFNKNYDYKYLKTHKSIKVEALLDDIFACNYMFFDNGLTNSKRIYAFITEKHYINQNCTELFYDIDVMQTFFDDVTIGNCFVEREHQNRYTKSGTTLYPKFNIEPENIEVGTDYDITTGNAFTKNGEDVPPETLWLEILSTEPVTSQTGYNSSTPSTWVNGSTTLNIEGVPTSLFCYLIPIIKNAEFYPTKRIYTYNGEGNLVSISNQSGLNSVLSVITKSKATICYRVLDYCPIDYTCVTRTVSQVIDGVTHTWTEYDLTFIDGYTSSNVADSSTIGLSSTNNSNYGGVNLSGYSSIRLINLRQYKLANCIDFNSTLSNATTTSSSISKDNVKNIVYEPKLKIYPYSYEMLWDNKSDPLVVKHENLDKSTTYSVKYVQNIGAQSKTKYYLNNYNGDSGKYYNTVNNTINELPLTSDAYYDYMAQNKASATTGVAVSLGTTALTMGLGLMTGGIGLAVAGVQAINTAGSIAQQVVKMQDLKNTPDSIRQLGNNAEFDIVDSNNRLRLYTLQIKDQFRQKLFEYFYHYGYKCNTFKAPNYRSRYYFNYLKTVGAVVNGNVDSVYKDKIRSILDNGVTIWHYRDSLTWKGVNNFTYENAEMSLT